MSENLTFSELMNSVDRDPKRKKDESFENYKQRMKLSKQIERIYLNGRIKVENNNNK